MKHQKNRFRCLRDASVERAIVDGCLVYLGEEAIEKQLTRTTCGRPLMFNSFLNSSNSQPPINSSGWTPQHTEKLRTHSNCHKSPHAVCGLRDSNPSSGETKMYHKKTDKRKEKLDGVRSSETYSAHDANSAIGIRHLVASRQFNFECLLHENIGTESQIGFYGALSVLADSADETDWVAIASGQMLGRNQKHLNSIIPSSWFNEQKTCTWAKTIMKVPAASAHLSDSLEASFRFQPRFVSLPVISFALHRVQN